ncbi:hypothetical protein GCM10008934_03700 [Virgibacillus salarius]
MKLALTEENPVIKTYEVSEWARLIDCELPSNVSLQLLESLHERWTYLLKNLTAIQFKRISILTVVKCELNKVSHFTHGMVIIIWHIFNKL